MNLKEIILKLNEKGFKHETNQFVNGMLLYIDMKNAIDQYIFLEVSPTNEFLDSLEDNKYEIDYNNFELESATFESVIAYPEGERNIYLAGDKLDYFWSAFEAFQDPVSWACKIMRKHLSNLEYFNTYIRPILAKYDFYPEYDSFWDTSDRRGMGSSPVFTYEHKYSSLGFSFYTDLITQKFMWRGGEVNYSHEFEEKFVNYLKLNPSFSRLNNEKLSSNN